jgi:hypothetical protein
MKVNDQLHAPTILCPVEESLVYIGRKLDFPYSQSGYSGDKEKGCRPYQELNPVTHFVTSYFQN